MKCLICSGPVEGIPATVYLFLKERAKLDGAYSLCYCQTCDFSFFWPRLTDEECLRYYTGYWGDEFVRRRSQMEAGYENYLASITTDIYLEQRVLNLRNIVPSMPKTILDVGGFDGFLGRRAFPDASVTVVDVGDTYPVGIFDLVVCAHVLEHVPHPLRFLENIKPLVGKHLYAEVPIDPRIPAMHEHLSHFNDKSFTHLVEKAGFTIVKKDNPMRHLAVLAVAADLKHGSRRAV